MLFGHRQHFGIEAYVEEELQIPSTVWGRMCIWSEGTMIGRLEEPYCSLHNSAERLKEMVEEFPLLWMDEFKGLGDGEIFHRFDHALYTGPVEAVVDRERLDVLRGLDFLTNWGEHFDGFKGCLVHRPDGDLAMMLRLPNDSLICRRVDPDLFVYVVKEFVEWFEREAARLRPDG